MQWGKYLEPTHSRCIISFIDHSILDFTLVRQYLQYRCCCCCQFRILPRNCCWPNRFIMILCRRNLSAPNSKRLLKKCESDWASIPHHWFSCILITLYRSPYRFYQILINGVTTPTSTRNNLTWVLVENIVVYSHDAIKHIMWSLIANTSRSTVPTDDINTSRQYLEP